MSKSDMALKMGTSRTRSIAYLTRAMSAVSLETLEKAARSVGKKLRIELIDA